MLLDNNLPIADIEKSTIQFFIAILNNDMVGVIGLEQYDETGLLRSLSVQDRNTNLKIGKKLVEHFLKHCKNNNIQEVYLLTTTAEKYFKKFDFHKISRQSASAIIKQTKEFSNICPMTAVLMKKKLIN